MFGFKKAKEKFAILAPISGQVLPITEVNDPVFSGKMMGDGFAIKPGDQAHEILSPISGEITMLPDSKHAIGIKSLANDALELLVHVGIDTVNLQGQGFTAKVQAGQTVKAGQPLLEFDPKLMSDKNFDMTTMVIFTSGYEKPVDLKAEAHQELAAGTAVI